jgi:hypothetical protein
MSFLDIPNVPGVPALASYAANNVALLAEDAIGALLEAFAEPAWGLYLFGVPILPTYSTVAFEYRQDWIAADYQVEQGSFESYDKVQRPFDVRMTVTSFGGPIGRQALVNAITTAAASLILFDVVTPEIVYPSSTIVHYDYRRSAAHGQGMIIMDVWLLQIQVVNTSLFQNTISPAQAGAVSSGTVTGQTPESTSSTSGFSSLPNGSLQ